MKKNETKKIHLGLLQQDVYVRDITPLVDLCTKNEPEFYDSIDEVTTENGVEIKKTQHSYDITPDYVNSFADSADYHTDPVGAINTSQKKNNLGDLTTLQEVISSDSEQLAALQARLASLREQLSAVQQIPTSAQNENITNNQGETE